MLKTLIIICCSIFILLFLQQNLNVDTRQDKKIVTEEKVLEKKIEIQTFTEREKIIQIKQKKEKKENLKLEPHHLYVASEDEIRQSFATHEKMEKRVREQRKNEEAHLEKQKFIKKMKQIKKEKENNE